MAWAVRFGQASSHLLGRAPLVAGPARASALRATNGGLPATACQPSRQLQMAAAAGALQAREARDALLPLIQQKLDGFTLWFFANKEKLEAQARGEACPHHESPDDCPSKDDPSHACPFTRAAEMAEATKPTWIADECAEAETQAEREISKAEQQLHLLEHALGPYARGERNAFRAPLSLTNERAGVEVASFDALLELYHAEIVAAHGADPAAWGADGDVQRLVVELTSKFLQAAEPDFDAAGRSGRVAR